MEIKSDELGVILTIPDRPTVRQQLRYKGEIGVLPGAELYLRLWAAAKSVITAWECAALTLDADLDGVTDPRAADVIGWAGLQVWSHMQRLERVPKN